MRAHIHALALLALMAGALGFQVRELFVIFMPRALVPMWPFDPLLYLPPPDPIDDESSWCWKEGPYHWRDTFQWLIPLQRTP
jgi:hypothetical protein